VSIVVGVDGSAESLQALGWAIAEARLRHTDLRAVYVWQYPFAPSGGDPFLAGASYLPAEIDAGELRDAAAARLAGVVERVETDGVELRQEVIEGHPAETLLDVAKDADLLVVGSRGHGGFAGLLLGSVSQACVHHARCPVVVIRGRSS